MLLTHALSLALLLPGASGGGYAAAMQRAAELERGGRDAEALALVDQWIQRQPASELLRLESARLRIKLGQELDRAQLDLETARSLTPENPRANYLWGVLMEERGEREAAARAYALALHYRSTYSEARFRLAGLYFAQGDWARAEEQYRALTLAEPQDVNARVQLARSLEKLGKLEETELELRRLHEGAPRTERFARALADFYERTGRPHLAEKVRRSLPEAPKKKMRELRPARR